MRPFEKYERRRFVLWDLASGFGKVDNSNFQHTIVFNSPGLEVEFGHGETGRSFKKNQDLVKTARSPGFTLASGGRGY